MLLAYAPKSGRRHMSYSVDQATYRQAAVMWAFIVMRQGDRLDEAAAEYDGTLLEQPRSTPPEVDDYRYWWATWTFGADQYFFLAAAAQLRKCVLKLPHDELPEVPNERMILLLRNFTEHWENPTGWSATELRGSVPGAIPGRATYTKKDVWVEGVSTTEIVLWASDVARVLRANAAEAGDPLPDPVQPFPGR
jgi:hypothetical protein